MKSKVKMSLKNITVVFDSSKCTHVIKLFKEDCFSVEDNTETELFRLCLKNNHDYKMINQLNLVTYAGPQ